MRVTLLPIVLYLLYLGGWWSSGLFAFAAGACAYEYIQITTKELKPIGLLVVLIAAAMPLLPVWSPSNAHQLISGATGVGLDRRHGRPRGQRTARPANFNGRRPRVCLGGPDR